MLSRARKRARKRRKREVRILRKRILVLIGESVSKGRSMGPDPIHARFVLPGIAARLGRLAGLEDPAFRKHLVWSVMES